MTAISSALVLVLATSALVLGDDDKADGTESISASSVIAASHAEVGDAIVAGMETMAKEMAKIEDVASAKAFAESVVEIKSNLKECLEVAQNLDEPTDEQKAAFFAKLQNAEEEIGAQVMGIMTNLANHPDAEAIDEVMQDVMEDKKMDQVMLELTMIYQGNGIGKQSAGKLPADK